MERNWLYGVGGEPVELEKIVAETLNVVYCVAFK